MQSKSTRRSFGLLFSSALFFPRLGREQSIPTNVREGDSWNASNLSAKYGYVSGFIDAAAWASANVDGALHALKSLSSKDRQMLAGGKDVWDFYNIKPKQLIEGMDSFYSDYRNKAILWDRALSYVRDTIHGHPADYLNRELEFERKGAILGPGQK